MKITWIYYIRDDVTPANSKRIIATVVLLRTPMVPSGAQTAEPVYCRGISIVGEHEQACRKVGRAVAEGRAEMAASRMESTRLFTNRRGSPELAGTRRKIVEYMGVDYRGEIFKSEFNVKLTEFERKLVESETP